MNISRKNIIIACTFGLVNLIVVIVVLIVANKNGSPDSPPKKEVFKRCDGLSDPIDEITISTCPDIAEVGYCSFDFNENIVIKLSFTPGKMRFGFNVNSTPLKTLTNLTH